MARKYELITDFYYQTINEVSENADSWKSFLKTAGRNFRLRFDEQILIYAQRPDAIAVLEIEKWNNRFGRWVNKGAKGIGTKAFDMEGALKQVQKLIDGGMKTKEAIKRVAQEMNGSKNELYDAYHKHI